MVTHHKLVQTANVKTLKDNTLKDNLIIVQIEHKNISF